MKNNNLFSLLILIVIGVAAYMIVQTVRDTSQTATAPFQALNEQNQAMQTQMASLLNPTPTVIPDPVTYINEIRALARLETIQYSVEKVVTCQVNQGAFDFAFGDKVLFVGHGVVIAGIDMEKLRPEDMRFENGVLTVNFPPSENLIFALDNQKSYVYDRQTGILVRPNAELETICRQSAEQEILNGALEDGILEQARTNAEAYLFKFFSALGFPNTIFVNDQG
ncbi:MAG: DUF4230 domain-containing protein [Anaerolineales bacterium]|nr:DUF4230 domain-containing protein [Anaerolineales bacterium]